MSKNKETYLVVEQFQPIRNNAGDATVGYYYFAWYPFGADDMQAIRYDKRLQMFEWCVDATPGNTDFPQWIPMDIAAFTTAMDTNVDVLHFLGGLQFLVLEALRFG